MKKFLLFAAVAATAMTASADWYVIGDNVNGNSWALASADAKMTDKGNGIYEWDGEILGSGFKFNDGTWDNGDYNWGSNGGALILGEAYYITASGTSGNIALDGMAEVKKPHIVLDENNQTVTVTGEQGEAAKWYAAGNVISTGWTVGNGGTELAQDGSILSGDVVFIAAPEGEAGEFKVANTGWGEQYGRGDGEEFSFDAVPFSAVLAPVGSTNGIPCTIAAGTYHLTFDLDTWELNITAAGEGAVEGIELDNAATVYYNLQGVRVANPENGLYIRVQGKKAVKVAL